MRFLPWLALAAAIGCSAAEEIPLLTVTRGRFAREVEVEGFLRASTVTPVAAPFSPMGALKIAWIIEDGSPVREGDVVARFDESAIAQELLDGRIALAMSERRIEQRGVRRESSLAGVEGDRRAFRVRLTDRGRRAFTQMAEQHEHWIVEAFEGLSPRDLEQLHKLLGKVKQHQLDLNQRLTDALE